MKPPFLAIALSLAFVLAGCAPVHFSRETIADNIAPVVALERRVDWITQESRAKHQFGILSREVIEALKEALDIYYVFYLAASVKLAEGRLDTYRELLSMAAREVDRMERLIREAREGDVPEPPGI